MANQGKFITPEQAKAAYERYQKEKPGAKALGHVYDLSKVQEVMQNIEAYNRDHAGNPVEALRLYLSWDEESPHEDKTDIIFVPITKDGKDIIDMDSSVAPQKPTGGDVLARGLPCPKYCD